MKRRLVYPLIACLLAAGSALAQETIVAEPPPSGVPAFAKRSIPELETLVAPIALYPDPLLAQVLPSCAASSDVVLAARYLKSGKSKAGIDAQPWAESVKAIARYPEVVKLLDSRLDATIAIGEAMSVQQADVMTAIQNMRARAQAKGNLRTTTRQKVAVEQDRIYIEPASEVLYVPIYTDLVYSTAYYDDAPWYRYSPGYAVGGWLNGYLYWNSGYVGYYGAGYRPGYGWSARPVGYGWRPPVVGPGVAVRPWAPDPARLGGRLPVAAARPGTLPAAGLAPGTLPAAGLRPGVPPPAGLRPGVTTPVARPPVSATRPAVTNPALKTPVAGTRRPSAVKRTTASVKRSTTTVSRGPARVDRPTSTVKRTTTTRVNRPPAARRPAAAPAQKRAPAPAGKPKKVTP